MAALIVYYDGACPFCTESMHRIKRLDTDGRLHFVDLNLPQAAADAAPRFTPKDLADEMHLQLPDGTWRIGFYAWAAIISVLPRLAWVSNIMLLPPIAEIGRSAYRLFASRRYLVSKLLGMPAPCDATGACKIPAGPRTTGTL